MNGYILLEKFGLLATTFGFGASPTTNTGFAFVAGAQPLSGSIGFGAASLGNTGFGFAFGFNDGLDGDFEMGDEQDNVQTLPAREPFPKPEPPEEPPVAIVGPKKKQKGKKNKEAPAAYFLAPDQPTADAEERAVMEEIKLSGEDQLEAELKRIEAEEAEIS